MDSPSGNFSSNFFGADTPSRLPLGPPSPWSFNLTPSLFGREHTPFCTGESNPFEASFGGSRHKAFTAEDLDLDRTPGDFFPMLGRRKRALSSPAITPGGYGINSFNYSFGEALDNINKRPKIESEDSSSAATVSKFGGSARDSETSPVSSVLTPPDSSSNFPSTSHNGSLSSEGYSFNPSGQQLNHDIFDSVLKSSQNDTPPTSSAFAPHSTYEQFVFAPSVAPSQFNDGSNTSTFERLQREHQSFANSGLASFSQLPPADIFVSGASVAAASTTLPNLPVVPAPKGGKKAKATLALKGGKKGGKKARAESVGEEEIEEEDEEARRKVFLERNRIAACKSRQKKKERVGNLETQASDYAARNVALQSVALSLREEVLQLRHLLGLHDGCQCEHVAGYVQREGSGGGIPTIDALAGRTLQLDYTNVPTMGSEQDVFGSFFRSEREGSMDSSFSQSTLLPEKRLSIASPAAISLSQATNNPPTISVGPAIPIRSTRAKIEPAFAVAPNSYFAIET